LRRDEARKVFKITVFFDGFTLKYHVQTYNKHDGKIYFTDPLIKHSKEFPDKICGVEEIE